MKPYGREKKIKHFPGKQDHRIRVKNKKIGNWWEDMCTFISRSAIRLKWKKESE